MNKLWLLNSILHKARDGKKPSLDRITGRNCPDAAKWAEGLKPAEERPKNPIDPFYVALRDLNSQPSNGDTAEACPKPAVEIGASLSF